MHRAKTTASSAALFRLRITASMLSGAHHLTRLEVQDCSLEPDALAGKTLLQHLSLGRFHTGGTQLLSHMQHLARLTHLSLDNTFMAVDNSSPPAADFSALTASSTLQNLSISNCELPAGVWQQVFSPGRLPHLQSLQLSMQLDQPWHTPESVQGPAPDGRLFRSCCPGLRSLDMRRLQHTAQSLAQLQGLSRLHTLRLVLRRDSSRLPLEALGQLTGLRELDIGRIDVLKEWLLPQLAKLTLLTALTCIIGASDAYALTQLTSEPVWRQLLRRHLNETNHAVTQLAAEGLAE